MSKIRLLIVEDIRTSAAIIRERVASIAGVDFNSSVVHTLAEAIDILSSDRFDLVILDIGLPDSSGIYTFKYIKKAAKDASIIVLTMTDDPTTQQQISSAGAHAYLIKGKVTDYEFNHAILSALRKEDVLEKVINDDWLARGEFREWIKNSFEPQAQKQGEIQSSVDELVKQTESLRTCVMTFHDKYDDTLEKIINRAAFLTKIKQNFIMTSTVAFGLGVMGGIGTAVWWYVKHLLVN